MPMLARCDVRSQAVARMFHDLDRSLADRKRFARVTVREEDHELIASRARRRVDGQRLLRRCATSRNRSSPALVQDLNKLNLSRSMTRTRIHGIALRLGDAWAIRSSSSKRFGNPVSASCEARWRSCRFAASSPCAIGDDQLETFDVTPECAGILPFAAQCAGTLEDLNRLERLLYEMSLSEWPSRARSSSQS